jgi:hypothetical protein
MDSNAFFCYLFFGRTLLLFYKLNVCFIKFQRITDPSISHKN